MSERRTFPRYFSSQTAPALRTQSKVKTSIYKKPKIVPGYTRTGGAYRRALPSAGETKFNDSTFNQTTATGGANISFVGAVTGVSLCLVPQATTDITRIGNKMFLKNIRIKGRVTLPTATTFDQVRIILYKDMQTNGAAAGVTDLLASADENSFLNMNNTGRFKVIKDKIIDLNPVIGVSSTSNTPYVRQFKMNHKANCRIDYSSNTGAITELRSNNYAVLVISTNGLATITGIARITFTDS